MQLHSNFTITVNIYKDANPPGVDEDVDAGQILLQLKNLLEVLHLHHGALKLQHNLRDVRQGRLKGGGGR